MANLNVDLAQVRPCAERTKGLAQELKALAGEVDGIRGNLRFKIAGREQIAARLRDISEKIVHEESVARSMSDALDRILSQYERAESANLARLIAEAIAGMSGASSAASATDGANTSENTFNHATGEIFGTDNSYIFTAADGQGINFHKGKAQQPRWEADLDYDNYYPYDPEEKASWQDKASWDIWSMAPAYGLVNYVPDGMRAYEHYRSGKGTPLEIDYKKAYQEDAIIRENVDKQVDNTNQAIREMIAKGEKPPFSITSELIPISQNPATENWQKTIGRHHVWISADVWEAEDGSIMVTSTVHELDRYNFNKGDSDIATGLKDSMNGRFETLGWAKSFDTHGKITFETTLSNETPSSNANSDASGRVGGRFGDRSDRSEFRSDRRESGRR